MMKKKEAYVPNGGEMEWLWSKMDTCKDGRLWTFRWSMYKVEGEVLVCVKSLDSVVKGIVPRADIEKEVDIIKTIAKYIGVKFKDKRGEK